MSKSGYLLPPTAFSWRVAAGGVAFWAIQTRHLRFWWGETPSNPDRFLEPSKEVFHGRKLANYCGVSCYVFFERFFPISRQTCESNPVKASQTRPGFSSIGIGRSIKVDKGMKWSKNKTTTVAGVVLILAVGIQMATERMVLDVPFRQESITRADQAKRLALACHLFADANGNRLPKDIGEVGLFVANDGFSVSNWELVTSGDLSSFVDPGRTILLREKEALKSGRGEFIKMYAFVDGHVDRLFSPDNNFSAVEKKRGFLAQAAGN
jgi:hypothetical protein